MAIFNSYVKLPEGIPYYHCIMPDHDFPIFFLDYYCISFNPIFSRLLSHIISHIILLYYHLSILGKFFQGRSDRGQVTGVKSRWLSVLVFFWVQLGFFSITTLLFGGIKWHKDGNNSTSWIYHLQLWFEKPPKKHQTNH
jgi:hypothetical protein